MDLRFSRRAYFLFANFNVAENAVRQRTKRNIRTPTWNCTLHVPLFWYEARNCNIGLHKAGRELREIDAEARARCFEVTRRRPEDLLWRHSCRTQTRYIARGCPLLDVIGRSLTSTVDGKFIGRLLPSSCRACPERTQTSKKWRIRRTGIAVRVLLLTTAHDAKTNVRFFSVLYPVV